MASGSWAINLAGTWSTAGNWTSSIIADGATFTASFVLNITATRTVTLDTSRTIGSVTSSDTTQSHNWIFSSSGGSILTLDNGASKPVLSGANGTITLTTPYFAQYNLDLGGTNGFDKQGAGNILISGAKTISGTVTVTSGQLALGNILQSNGAPAATGNCLPNITSYSIASTTANLVVCSNTSFTFPSTLTGSGGFLFRASAAGIVLTCPVGTFSGFANASATYGAGVYLPANATCQMDVNDYSEKTVYVFDSATGASNGIIRYMATSDLTTSTNIVLYMATNVAGHEARFQNVGAGRLSVTGTVGRASAAGTITFILGGTNALDNELSGVISNAVGVLALTKESTGTWILSGTNTYTGANALNAGTLNLRNGAALGSSAATAATTLTSGTLQVQGGITINKASSAWALNGSTVQNVSGNNTITASSWTIGTAQTILVTADSLTVTNAIAGTSARSLDKTGAGTLSITNTASGYLGTVTVSAGTLRVTKFANVGVSSSLGASALAQATITMGSDTTLTHAGTTADSTDRVITSTASSGSHLTLDSSGTGAGGITFSSGGTLTFSTAGTHTLFVTGTNAATNTLARTLADSSGGGAVSLTKNGSNTWSLTGAITATGAFTCNSGTLNFGATNRTLSGGLTVAAGTVSITNGNTIAANTTMSGGTITAVLTGANTLTVTTGAIEAAPAVLQPDATTTGSNTFTGNVTVNGCIDLVTPTAVLVTTAGNGEVLGDSNTVTVSGTGIVRTKSAIGSSQRGQARYNNLTLQSGSTLKIGFAT